MCGLVGVVGKSDVAVCLYDTLTVLQHRGQDAAGIATSDNGKLNEPHPATLSAAVRP